MYMKTLGLSVVTATNIKIEELEDLVFKYESSIANPLWSSLSVKCSFLFEAGLAWST